MTTIAYIYINPDLDSVPKANIWGKEAQKVYIDVGDRLQLNQLIEDCRNNQVNYLLIRKLEELGDSLQEIGTRLKQIESLGIEIIATEQGYHTHNGDFLQHLQQIQDNLNRRNLQQAHARNRFKGLPPPGKAPYGYRKGKERYILDRSSAPVVKDFLERFLLFGSLRGAVRYLEKRYGKKISVSTGRKWLTNPVYRGDLVYHNNQIISDTHVPIISREEAAQIDRLLRRNSRLPSRTASAPRSLAGLVVCQQCQSNMTITKVTAKGKKQEYLYLRPVNCTNSPKCKSISYQEVLQMTIKRICEDLPEAVAKIESNNLEKVKGFLQEEINQKEGILAQLYVLKDNGILDEETLQIRSYKVRTEIAQTKAKLAELPPVNLQAIALTVSIPQFWLDLSESERRFYFREFIGKIEISRQSVKIWTIQLVFIF